MTDKKCHKCGSDTKPGKVMVTTYRRTSDFGNDLGVTCSPGGPGKLTDCQKCTKCGTSVVYVSRSK